MAFVLPFTYMEWILIVVAVLQSVAISLGVGSSTIAILNFFVAIKDGTIEPSERAMMGIVYIVLRIAMVAILVTMATWSLQGYALLGGAYFTPFVISQWFLVAVLYTNAVLMTKRIMPSTFGPAIQASTWYTLGITTSLIPLGLTGYSLFHFFLGYIAVIVLAVGVVNGMMSAMKAKRAPKQAAPAQQ